MPQPVEIQVVLERSNGSFQPGEQIAGQVWLRSTAGEAVQCRRLVLDLHWQVKGDGEPTEGPGASEVIPAAPLLPGAEQRYPFSFQAPTGPLSYQGHLFSVSWELRARLELSGAQDAQSGLPIQLVRGTAQEISLGPQYRAPAELDALDQPAWVPPVVALFFLVGLAAAVMVPALMPPGALRVLFTLPGAGVALGMGVLLYVLHRRRLAEQRLGPVTLRLERDSVRPGERLAYTLSFRPRQAIELLGVTATLRGVEQVTRGRGQNATALTRLLSQEQSRPMEGRRVEAGEELRIQDSLPVPADAPPTFMAAYNALTWQVKVQVSVRGLPDWVRERNVTVRP